MQPIEQIRIGRRVMTHKDDRSGPTVDPEQYRVVTFSCVKDGQEIIFSLLRPTSLLEEQFKGVGSL